MASLMAVVEFLLEHPQVAALKEFQVMVALQGCREAKSLEGTRRLHAIARAHEAIGSHEMVRNALICAYGACKSLHDAEAVFKEADAAGQLDEYYGDFLDQRTVVMRSIRRCPSFLPDLSRSVRRECELCGAAGGVCGWRSISSGPAVGVSRARLESAAACGGGYS